MEATEHEKPASMFETESSRKFDMVFKSEALAVWANSSKSAKEIASEQGICSANVIYIWRQKLTAPSSHYGSQTPVQQAAEIQELRHENKRLRQQRDFQKNFGYPLRTSGPRYEKRQAPSTVTDQDLPTDLPGFMIDEKGNRIQ